MNKLNISTGGHPFSLDDLKHMQDAYTQIFKYLGKSLYNVGDYTILYGCDLTITGSYFTAVSEGLVYLNGELLYVPAQTISILTANEPCIFPTNTNTTLVTYQDGTSKNVHQVRVGIVADASGIALVDYFGFSLFKRLRDKAEVSFAGLNWQTGFSLGEKIYVKRRFDTVTFDGVIKPIAAPSTGGEVVFRIPAAFRPERELAFPVAEVSLSSGLIVEHRLFSVRPNGDVLINGNSGTVSVLYTISNITYQI